MKKRKNTQIQANNDGRQESKSVKILQVIFLLSFILKAYLTVTINKIN